MITTTAKSHERVDRGLVQDGLSLASLLAGLLVFALALLANRLGVRNWLVYFLLGVLVWFAFVQSGVHATIAALMMSFAIPARSRSSDSLSLRYLHRRMHDLEQAIKVGDVRAKQHAADCLDIVLG
ncbi:MAG: Na+/H+ antiporter NhaA [Myxococcota bacterium]|jgi:NhaA family Na+:H+ antiporter|nr:Na+/H+ antiporter NhaA [Myxococcota bacterium]